MELRLSPELYRGVLESLPTGVYLVDRNRRITFWNHGAEQLTGYLGQEVIGRYCHDNLLMHCDENHTILCGVACPLAQTMHDGHPRNADVFLRHKDGQRIAVRVRAVPVRDENGSIVGAVECFDERCLREDRRHCSGPNCSPERATDIPHYDVVRARLQEGLEEFAASRTAFGVLCVAVAKLEDLRHNDGTAAVHAILHAIARTLFLNLRRSDVMGWWTEERFVAVITGCDSATLVKCAERLKGLAAMAGVPWWGDRLSVTLSIGGTMIREGDSLDSLLARAEEALQISLRENGDQVVVA